MLARRQFLSQVVGDDAEGWSITVITEDGERVHLAGLYVSREAAKTAERAIAIRWIAEAYPELPLNFHVTATD